MANSQSQMAGFRGYSHETQWKEFSDCMANSQCQMAGFQMLSGVGIEQGQSLYFLK